MRRVMPAPTGVVPVLACFVVLMVAADACRQATAPQHSVDPAVPGHDALAPADASASAADASLPAVSPKAADAADQPEPLQVLQAAEIRKLTEPWTGDFDRIASGERRFIRALIPVSHTLYYTDGPVQKGIAFESLREFEKAIGESLGPGHVKPKIVIVPTSRDRLLVGLEEGRGEIALGGFTVTESRQQSVDFSEPVLRNVRHVVVAGRGVAALASLNDLSGREVHVRRGSSYHEDLVLLNERFGREGRKPVRIVDVDEMLEDEDILQMVDGGILPLTITKTFYADVWKQVYDQLTVYDGIATREGADIAWAIRRNTPLLAKVVNDFVRTHRAGTSFGNVMRARYLGDARRLRNPAAAEDLAKFRAAADLFKKYGDQYGFDWLVIAAQAYQESRMDQSLESPAGAVGVMQIKPATAAELGISDVKKLDGNIHAGVKYVRYLADRYYRNEPMDRLNRGLFSFASYNAGPAKVRRIRAKAGELGLNPNLWFNNVELVAGDVIGSETVDYVSNIYKYYTAYQAIAAQQQRKASSQRTTRR